MALALTQQVRELRKELDSIKAEATRLAQQVKQSPQASAKPAPAAATKGATSSAPATPSSTTSASKPAPSSSASKPAPSSSASKPAPSSFSSGAKPAASTTAASKPAATPAASKPSPAAAAATKPAPTAASKPAPSSFSGGARGGSGAKPTPGGKSDKPSVINVSNEDGIRSLVEQVKKGVIDWVVLGYEDNNNKIGLKVSGSGGVASLKQSLAEDQALYAVLRVAAAGTTAVKFVFITWIGPRVPALKKARVSTHRDSVGELFGSCHIRMQTDSQDELTPQSIDAKIRHAAGTDYDRGY